MCTLMRFVIGVLHLMLFGDQIKKMGWTRRVARMEKKSSYSVLVGKCKRKNLFGRPRLTRILLKLIF